MRALFGLPRQGVAPSRNDEKRKKLSHFTLSFYPHSGFTLSEVLITLGIIGVVAAFTIPTLVNAGKEKEYTVGLQKFYSVISQAMVTMQNADSPYTIPINDTALNESNGMRDNLCGILSCVKKDTVLNVWGTSISWLDSKNTVYKNYKSTYRVYTDLDSIYAAATLKDGMFIAVGWNWENRNGFQLFVDTNGAKGPNMFGDDLNMFEIVHDDSMYYKPVVEGGQGTTIKISAGNICLTNQSSYPNAWPCSYDRLYAPDKMP